MCFKRLYPISALISALLLSLLCTRSDVITDAGASVVGDVDSTQTATPGRGFVRVTLDSLYRHLGPGGIVDSAFSLPGRRDSLFGTYMSGGMFIGISEEGDELAAHVQYRAAGGASRYFADSEYTALDSAYIRFRAADALSGGPINLFLSDTLGRLAPVNRGDSRRIGVLSISGAGAVDSVKLPDTIAERIFNARRSSDATAIENIAFSIVDYRGNIRKLDNPLLFIAVRVMRPHEDTVTVFDSISGTVRSTAFESADSAEQRAAIPYSSHRTQRTAVFRINMKKVFETLSAQGLPANNCEVMNALAAVQPNIPASKNVGTYMALILDTLLTRETLSDSAAAANSRLLSYEFKDVGATAPALPYDPHDFRAAMRGVLRKYRSTEPPYIYIYLRPVTEGSVIMWDGPQKIETVFTHSR